MAYVVAARLWRGHSWEQPVAVSAQVGAAVILLHVLFNTVLLPLKNRTLLMEPVQGSIDNLWLGLVFSEAAIFYLLYLAGVLHFVSLPAFRAGAPVAALTEGALLGLLAYGTFELTSHAVMRDWSVSLVAADMAWGAALTGISAWGGVMIARALR